MKELVLLVGPPGSGKSTYSEGLGLSKEPFYYVNQDSQGKEGHLKQFKTAILAGDNVIVDRMNFSKEQRNRYLVPAKEAGYKTKIIVLHENYNVCFNRCKERKNHETIKTERDACSALHTFFTKYERVTDDEADVVNRVWPECHKFKAIICDLDGTLCNIDHRLHFVKQERKDWKGFFKSILDDKVNQWCKDILDNTNDAVVLCSGRPDDYMKDTMEWLQKNNIYNDDLFMRMRNDFRPDDIVKEVILDFEILTRYEPYLFIDDRKNVVDMWRRRGYTCLQCNEGNF